MLFELVISRAPDGDGVPAGGAGRPAEDAGEGGGGRHGHRQEAGRDREEVWQGARGSGQADAP